jgi:nucleoside-diphosphate-sugar epimerase
VTEVPKPARTIVVTGAGGMVGQNLVPRLLAAGHRIIALDRSAPFLQVLGERAPAAERHVVDLSERGPWMDLFADADVVVDLKAQITSPDFALHEKNNARATSMVVEACERHGTRHLVHLSSSVVISRAEDFYTRTKRSGEAAVRGSRVPHTILRPPLMFGPGDIKHLGLILKMMRILPIIPLPGDGKFIRQPLYVGDLCAVIEKCLDREPRGDIHDIIGVERIPFLELLRTIRATAGARCVFFPLPLSLFRIAIRIQRSISSRTIFTIEQLDALTAGDDFPVTDWPREFGVPFSGFREQAPRVYGEDDALRVRLLAALRHA